MCDLAIGAAAIMLCMLYCCLQDAVCSKDVMHKSRCVCDQQERNNVAHMFMQDTLSYHVVHMLTNSMHCLCAYTVHDESCKDISFFGKLMVSMVMMPFESKLHFLFWQRCGQQHFMGG